MRKSIELLTFEDINPMNRRTKRNYDDGFLKQKTYLPRCNACTGELVPGQGLARYWHSTAPVLRPSVG